ncbi:YcxB family protein [Actinomadura scrupuli]|uniref:YcxB family protein n=1 Tax=Actinomadura scrupuli TaxID=559629 RepID=UPI003D9745CD
MQETSAVELAYLPTTADAVGAIRARMRATPSGRLQNGILLAGAIIVLGVLVTNLTGSREPGSTVRCLAGLALLIGMYVLLPTLRGRRVYRMVATQGEFQAIVDTSGVRVTSRDTETRYQWPMLTRYAETDELFVLMTPDKHGIGFVVLPKRGAATPADLDRLQAVLDRNSTRA